MTLNPIPLNFLIYCMRKIVFSFLSVNLLPPFMKILIKHWLKIFGWFCACKTVAKLYFWYIFFGECQTVENCTAFNNGGHANLFSIANRYAIANLQTQMCQAETRKFADQKVPQSQKFSKPANSRIFVMRNLFVLVSSSIALVLREVISVCM